MPHSRGATVASTVCSSDDRYADVSRRAVSGIGLDNSPFSIEFFCDQTYDRVGLLEINPRISQAHTDLFEKVYGFSHRSIMLDVALGRKPEPPMKSRSNKLQMKCPVPS
ncbi:MAG: hypothetical protein EA404_09575 [Spirochaetaceae bacterium]|nr:MAG: hypothetical protein EA404_09575 [Spirochaetaceae bacterium]